jgi:hypothetical protein
MARANTRQVIFSALARPPVAVDLLEDPPGTELPLTDSKILW